MPKCLKRNCTRDALEMSSYCAAHQLSTDFELGYRIDQTSIRENGADNRSNDGGKPRSGGGNKKK